jgi:purine catabolism regulator
MARSSIVPQPAEVAVGRFGRITPDEARAVAVVALAAPAERVDWAAVTAALPRSSSTGDLAFPFSGWDRRYVALVMPDGAAEPDAVVRTVRRLLERHGAESVSVGVGAGVTERHAICFARWAAEPPATASPTGAAGGAAKPGSLRLLLDVPDAALVSFTRTVLGALARIDDTGTLRRSLMAYIEANGNHGAAAGRIGCHRHTVRRRMQAVERMTGCSLACFDHVASLWLALRAEELLGGLGRVSTR